MFGNLITWPAAAPGLDTASVRWVDELYRSSRVPRRIVLVFWIWNQREQITATHAKNPIGLRAALAAVNSTHVQLYTSHSYTML